MADWRRHMDQQALRAFHLEGRDVTVTIARVDGGTIVQEGGKKKRLPLVYFVEPKSGLPLALNAGNGKTIASLYGNDDEAWVGKKITLFPTTTMRNGETVDCIRVRPVVPAVAKKGDAK